MDEGEGGTADSSADIFRGEVAAEMSRLEGVLASLAARGRELLEQWPEHPALQSLQEVCERLRSFRAGTPLMKFVTGVELLLKTCLEWEEVAARHTSIKPHIDALSGLVLRWRKMELHAWPALLATGARRPYNYP